MEISEFSKEINLTNTQNIIIKKNNFNELGTIIQIEGKKIEYENQIISFIFYDSKKNTIPAKNLILLTNQKNFFFENLLFISTLKNKNSEKNFNLTPNKIFENPKIEEDFFLLKFLNEEIKFFKILIINKNFASNFHANFKCEPNEENFFNFFIDCENFCKINFPSNLNSNSSSNEENKNLNLKEKRNLENFGEFENFENFENLRIKKNSEIFDLNKLNKIDNKNSKCEKKDQINLILEELNKVNLSLLNEKEILEKQKIEIKNREENVNAMILNFKKEIYTYSDKLIYECGQKFTGKVSEISKKINSTELNLANKFKLIKEKYAASSKTKDNKNFGHKVGNEKIANLEIRIKQNEENMQIFRNKILEKDEIIKSLQEIEDKLAKQNKKLKDEINFTNKKFKELNEKLNKFEANVITNNENNNNNKEIKDNNNQLYSNISNLNKKKSILRKYEFSKITMDNYIQKYIINENINFDFIGLYRNFSYIYYSDSINDIKEISNLLIAFFSNPINLFKENPLSLIFLNKKISIILLKIYLKELVDFTQTNNNNLNNLLRDYITDICNNHQEINKQFFDAIKNNPQEEYQDLQGSNNNNNINSNFNISNAKNYLNNFPQENFLFSIDLKIPKEKKENFLPENSSNNSLGNFNIFDNNNNNNKSIDKNSESINLNNIFIKKIQNFQTNYLHKKEKEKKFLENPQKNYMLYKFSKLGIYLIQLSLSNNHKENLCILNTINENYIFNRDNFMIIFLLKNFYLEKILLLIKILHTKNKEILLNYMKLFIEVFLFLYSNEFIKFEENENTEKDTNFSYSDILKFLIFKNKNFCEILKEIIRNNIYNITGNMIINENVSEFNKKFLVFFSLLKIKMPNEVTNFLGKNEKGNVKDNLYNILLERYESINKENLNDEDINYLINGDRKNIIEENLKNIVV